MQIVNIICDCNINFNRLKYVIDFINEHPLCPNGVKLLLNSGNEGYIKIYYTVENESGYIIPVQNLLFSNKKEFTGDLFINEYEFNGNKYYSVEKIGKLPYFFNVENIFAFDIFEAIFFHISRYEEYFFSKNHLDKHGRMKSGAQLLVKNNLHHIPVVDHLISGFFESLGFDIQERRTDFNLTHDIDIIRKFDSNFKLVKSIGRVLLMGLGIKGVKKIVNSFIISKKDKTRDPYYTYEWLFREENYFKKKIVFLVAGGKTRQDLYNKNYLKELPDIIQKAKDKSYDIGLHPSYNAYNYKLMFEKELKLLKSESKNDIKYVRIHFLRLDLQKTFNIIEDLGFEYDSTLGYNDEIGFRCGTGFEYFPYNFEEEKRWEFKELPLVIMDSALLKSCKDDNTCFEEKIDNFLGWNKYNTQITFNFHNSTFDRIKISEKIRNSYIDLIKLTK
jgi:hypothetical protein